MDIMQAINMRRSVRSYSSEPIPAEVLDRMRTALWSAPSAKNLQPWRFIFVTDANLRKQLVHAANDQEWLADAPLIIAACGLRAQAAPGMGGHRNSVEIDVAIAIDHLTLAAVADGLGTCWIGAFKEQAVKELLDVPADVDVIAMTPLGYPASEGLNFPLDKGRRKPPADVFAENKYTWK